MTTTTTTNATLEQLTKIGGKLWDKNGARRVYFNNLDDLFGLETELFGTGNIRTAWLDGEKISNCYARKILGELARTKMWIDLANGSIQIKIEHQNGLGYNYDKRLTQGLLERIAEL